MTTRLGKIAQLPKSIRDELNRRLENGQQSPELLRWLNGHPKTKKFLAKKFDNQPISKSNLSHWRHGGFQDWRMDQAREARIQRISETGDSLEQAEAGDLFENFARMAVAELATDLDSLSKLRGEKRTQHLHSLVLALARLQNAYNRSRWAELAWTKYNHSRPAELETTNSKPETPCPTTTVEPDHTQSQGVSSRDSEAKPLRDPIQIVHHTRCECGEPCPKCHAPDSDYPLDEVLRDKQFKREHGDNPYDRHGNQKLLMYCDCDCPCDRCANLSGRVALPRDPIFPHERPASDESPKTSIVLETQIPSVQLTDFSRRMALLKTAQ